MTVSVSLCHLTFGLAWAMLGEICRSGTPTKSQRTRPFELAHRKPRPIREYGSGMGEISVYGKPIRRSRLGRKSPPKRTNYPGSRMA